MLQTVRAEKVDEKNGVICLVSMFPSWVMVHKFSKKGHFLQFCADLSKKSKSVKAIYIYASEVLITLFQKMIFSIRFWATVHEILTIKISEKMLTQQTFNKILRLQTLIFLKVLSHSIMNNTIFWKYVTRLFRCIYVNCFNRLRFPAVCNIHFWIWKYSKFIFMWCPIWSTLVCKIPQFFG